jgi:hypothetical protein
MVPGAELRARLAALPVFVIPWQCSLVAPPRDMDPVEQAAITRREEPIEPAAVPPRREDPVERSAITPKREQPVERVPSPPLSPPERAITLPEEVVVKAMDAGHQAFLHCWARAQNSDAPPSGNKIRLHLDIDAHGRVSAVRSDTDSPKLAGCLAVVARRLPFPAPGQPAVVEVPLMFR